MFYVFVKGCIKAAGFRILIGYSVLQPYLWVDMQYSLFIFLTVVCDCSSSTNRLITSKDVASVQLNVGHVDENGVYTGQFTTFALCGFVRAQVWFSLLC